MLSTRSRGIDARAPQGPQRDLHRVGRVFLVIVCLGVFVLSAASRTDWIIDDALIYQRVVRNAVRGHGLVFNVGESTEAVSSPLWSMILYVCGVVRQTDFRVARLLGVLAGLGTLGLVLFASPRTSDRVSTGLAALALAIQPAFAWWATSGMETPLCALAATVTALGVWRDDERWALAGASSLVVLRPEGALFGLSALSWIAVRGRPWSRFSFGWSGLALRVGVVVLPALLWEVFRLFTYGKLVANSADAKLATNSIVDTNVDWRAWGYFGDALRVFPGEILAGATALVCVAIGRNRNVGAASFLCVLTVSVSAFVIRVRGDWMPHARLLLPIMPVFLLFAARVAGVANPRVRLVVRGSLAMALILALWRQGKETTATKPPVPTASSVPPLIASPHRLVEAPLADGWSHLYAAALLRYTIAGDSVLHLDVGQSGYLAGDVTVMDQFGLVSRFECDFLRGRKNDEQLQRRFADANPSLVFLLARKGTRVPAARVGVPLRAAIEAHYVEVARHAWWGEHDLVVLVRRDAAGRTADPARLTRWIRDAAGLRWDTARILPPAESVGL